MELICPDCNKEWGWRLVEGHGLECMGECWPPVACSIASLPARDACPFCGEGKWRYDPPMKKWLRTCCMPGVGASTLERTKRGPPPCTLCNSSPHKKSCGLWSPYQEGSECEST